MLVFLYNSPQMYVNAGFRTTSPLVSILWLYYNSLSFINTILESLEGVLNLEYSNYELIILDNNSTDGSLEKIEELNVNKAVALLNKKPLTLNQALEVMKKENPQ
jgi:glycosyltransferase involved in cell wall biosynthesis